MRSVPYIRRGGRTFQEEGEEYENVAAHSGTGHGEAHVEDVQLIQPLGGEETNDESAATTSSSTVRCKAGFQGPCVRDLRYVPEVRRLSWEPRFWR